LALLSELKLMAIGLRRMKDCFEDRRFGGQTQAIQDVSKLHQDQTRIRPETISAEFYVPYIQLLMGFFPDWQFLAQSLLVKVFRI
jgi:hypothetical protein